MSQFWGERYRNYFVDYCLPSLLAPNNLPLLRAEAGHCFLIATPREDWEAIEHLPNMDYLRRFVTPVLIETPPPAETDYASILKHQTFSLKRLFEAAYAHKGYGCVFWPDHIISEGLVLAMQRWVDAGYHIVMLPTVRMTEEDVLAHLRAMKVLPQENCLSITAGALALPPRIVADLSVRYLHPELLSMEEGHPDQPSHPPYRFWRVPNPGALILHVFFATPVLMDFSVVPADHTDCLEHGDWETFYVGRNFSDCGGLYVVSDSDEAGILSITPRAVNRSGPNSRRRLGARWIPHFAQLCSLRESLAVYARCQRHAVQRDMFRVSVCWHAGDIDEVLREEERRIVGLIDRAAGDYYTDLDRFPPRISLYRRFFLLDVFIELQRLARILRVVSGAVSGDREDAARIRQWFRKLSLKLSIITRSNISKFVV